MSDFLFDVHQGGRLIGHADLDLDTVVARIIAGKAVYAVTPRTGETTGISGFHRALLNAMAFNQVIVDHTDEDRPMQVKKLGHRKSTARRVSEEAAASIPARFTVVSTPSIRYNTKKLTPDHLAYITEQRDLATGAALPKPHVSVPAERLFSRIIRYRNERTAPLKAQRDHLTAKLNPEYDAIAEALSLDLSERWTLRHHDSGLVIDVGGTTATRSEALSAYRKHLTKSHANDLLVTEEIALPPKLDIRPHVGRTEDFEGDPYAD